MGIRMLMGRVASASRLDSSRPSHSQKALWRWTNPPRTCRNDGTWKGDSLPGSGPDSGFVVAAFTWRLRRGSVLRFSSLAGDGPAQSAEQRGDRRPDDGGKG